MKPAKRTVITLRSPMVAENSFGNDSTAVSDVLHAIFPERNLSDLSSQTFPFFEEGIYGGYHAKWGMPLPQRTALVPGSEVVIYGLELSKEDTLLGYEKQSIIAKFGSFENFKEKNAALYRDYITDLIATGNRRN